MLRCLHRVWRQSGRTLHLSEVLKPRTSAQPDNQALAKTLTVDELSYLKEQFVLLEPNKSGTISLDNVEAALTKSATDAMKESHVLEFLTSICALIVMVDVQSTIVFSMVF
ncbi:unnamed protein product [Camellia sinensis]